MGQRPGSQGGLGWLTRPTSLEPKGRKTGPRGSDLSAELRPQAQVLSGKHCPRLWGLPPRAGPDSAQRYRITAPAPASPPHRWLSLCLPQTAAPHHPNVGAPAENATPPAEGLKVSLQPARLPCSQPPPGHHQPRSRSPKLRASISRPRSTADPGHAPSSRNCADLAGESACVPGNGSVTVVTRQASTPPAGGRALRGGMSSVHLCTRQHPPAPAPAQRAHLAMLGDVQTDQSVNECSHLTSSRNASLISPQRRILSILPQKSSPLPWVDVCLPKDMST